MHVQEKCFLLRLCFLGGVAFSLTTANTEVQIATTPDINSKDTLGVQPLQTEWQNNITELKAYPAKEVDIKAAIEAKKKPLIDFKTKGDQKYQKPVIKEDDSKKNADSDALMTLSISSTTTPINFDQSSMTMKSINATSISIPFLLRGEPIISMTKTTLINNLTAQNMMNTVEAQTEETMSSRGRALNISSPEPTNSLHTNITDLSDISMDEDDKNVEGGEYIASHNETAINVSSTLFPKIPTCIYGNRTYSVGEEVIRDCQEKCICSENGITNCQPLCVSPYVRAGKRIEDPLCEEKLITEESCCALVVCATDSATEPEETCIFGNKTVTRGQRIEDGCSKVCICEADGHLKCQPRCPPNDTTSIINQHERCVVLTDPRDACCTITLCDVTLGDHEIKSENTTDLNVHLIDAKVLNSTAIKLKMSVKNIQDITVEISQNNHVWRQQKPDKDGILSNLEPAHTYYVRLADGSRTGPAIQVFLPAEVVKTNISEKSDKNSCNYRGKSYKIGAEWYDECINFCVCAEDGKAECNTIECPTDFGLDVLDPHCLDWETVPENFVPKPPQCCPQEVRCRNNGSCNYEGVIYDNWSELPSNVTGCEKRCYCEMGNVSCREACKPVPALPPTNLPCPPHQATLMHLPVNPCCLQWTCNHLSSQLPGLEHNIVPPGFSLSGFATSPSSSEVIMQVLEALDEHTVRLVFTIPQVLVGLHGRVELRYTSDKTNFDPSTWKVQVFAPPNDLIATPQLEFELGDLKPMTEYKMKITVKLKDLTNSPTSKIYSVRTLEKRTETITLPPQIPIDTELRIMQTNSTWINVMWKKFTEYELQFIDGVQLRYKEHDGKVYATTPLIHRAVTNYVIENLKPSTIYEIGIYFIPFPGQSTELLSEKTIQVATLMEPDPYSFDIKVEIKTIKSTNVEVLWSGVPYPEDKYVNIYRAIYQSDTGKEDTSIFKIAKRDSDAKTVINDLKPGTRYRLWLEIYLTNGRIKKSNVQDFITKPGLLPATVSQQAGKIASFPLYEGDYYGPLVIVAIVASLAILSTLILLMILMKRRTSSKADISSRKTTSAYDNPSYKTCEDMVMISNGRNKTTDHEMAIINLNIKETA
ncbi:Putative epidermal cell surface receptor [Camponotus floridanus]|uniref:Putative epidermal cell surface receptor n=1 Tax=Camponotus floridanus TaxID=104421 RepID=E2ABW4_CAMFO|nr:putative epidermal cell surface receptor isoform X1 [Camponotus floridanus]EFN69059.1 Putative epidermal cell surface receptor [Camponotus floridanus]